MAINPVRFLPQEFPENPRPVPIDFAWIGDIGREIGQDRLRQQIGQLTVTNPETGQIDYDRTNANLARAGLLGPEAIQTAGARREALAQSGAGQAEQARHHRALEEFQNRPRYQYNQPDPILGGGNVIEERPGQPPVVRPWPGAPAAAPATPGPQSALPGGPNVAAFDPENAPPYRVAGPPMPPPQGPATTAPAVPATQPAAAAARNDAYLRALPTDAARTLVKAIADYEIDPASVDSRLRAQLLAAAKTYRPDYSASEYQKRGSPPSGEVAARIGLSNAFLEKAPAIRERLQANELNSWQGAATALWGQGGPGELRRAIDEGSEALLRGLTGAGMGITEAQNYARRYQFDLRDNKGTAIQKLNELENALRHVTTEVGKGRGGEDLLKDYRSQFGQSVAVNAPDKAVRDLQNNPQLRDQFDSKYGAGSAERILGARR